MSIPLAELLLLGLLGTVFLLGKARIGKLSADALFGQPGV